MDVDFEGKQVNFAIRYIHDVTFMTTQSQLYSCMHAYCLIFENRFLQQYMLNLNIGFSFSFAASESSAADLDALLTSSLKAPIGVNGFQLRYVCPISLSLLYVCMYV